MHLQKVNIRKKERNRFDARHGTVTRPDNVQVRWPGDNENGGNLLNGFLLQNFAWALWLYLTPLHLNYTLLLPIEKKEIHACLRNLSHKEYI